MTEALAATTALLTPSYLDKLMRANADDLAFYPLTTLARALEDGHVIGCDDNGEPAGYLWFGAVRGGYDVVIYQAAVDYDSRRRHLGYGMVRSLLDLARAGGATGIKLKCASSAESNEFWRGIGFVCSSVKPGGIKRGRDINVWRAEIAVGLWTPESFAVEPSDRPIDLRAYQALVRSKVKMPSRFSRNHY